MSPDPLSPQPQSEASGAEPSGADNPNQGEKRSGWVTAPASSHVDGYEFIDRSESSYGASSVIIVRFGGPGRNNKPPQTYRYTFSRHDQAKAVWDALVGAASPGTVIDAEIKKKNVPFVRVS